MKPVLTIDLEDWYHSLEPEPAQWSGFEQRLSVGTELLLDIFERTGSRATFFVLGSLVRQNRELIRKIQSRGHEIGSHGMYHRFVYEQTPDEFRTDLHDSISLLEDVAGCAVRSYRAPYFSITHKSLWALEIVRDEGILFDSSIFPVRNPRYGIPGAERHPHEIIDGLIEWPITTWPSLVGNLPYSGGVYFRFLPWRLVHQLMRARQNAYEPVMFYLHPWELDPQQPRYRTPSLFLNFRHYWRLGATERKLENLLQRFQFVPLAEAASEMIPERVS